jgi:threonine/homoserine/homoserine lactone efflux protein
LRGVISGLVLAAPVGPVGLLCIRRTLMHGSTYGIVSGAGVATADAIYSFSAAFAFAALMPLLPDLQLWLGFIGAAILFYLAVGIWRSAPPQQAATVSQTASGLWGAYLSILLFTLTSPATILIMASFFSTVQPNQAPYILWLAVGIPLGSILWWVVLAGVIGVIGSYMQPTWLRWINRLSALILIGFALWALWTGVMALLTRFSFS